MPTANVQTPEELGHDEPSSWNPDRLRTQFVQASSDMYRAEVPLYGTLVDLVRDVDASVLASRGQAFDDLPVRHQLERHGAIRLGTSLEMRLASRLFAVMGMRPVGYYDLKVVGFPLHGTAFRPTTEHALRRNPFRVFATVLRPDLISSDSLRETALKILAARQLFSPRLVDLMDRALSKDASLTSVDADDLIEEALKVFKWHSRSTVPLETYLALKREHPIIADIVCFPSAHINHLTPRTLDIDAVQAAMVAQGLPAKECIEGPPPRHCEILLRQTSFKALEERVVFSGGLGDEVAGTHTARFGEVEQRGAAVTRKGRDLYDRLLARAVATSEREDRDADAVLKEVFTEFPDDWEVLRTEGLVYFRYRAAGIAKAESVESSFLKSARAERARPVHMERLVKQGLVTCEPITFEDFLPFSAAGIFASNLGSDQRKLRPVEEASARSRLELEELLDSKIPSEIDLYDELQQASIDECAKDLGLRIV